MTTSSSAAICNDSIVSITPQQLKKTNLIFAEHSKLIEENKLLKEQVSNYKQDNLLLVKSDSIRQIQINTYKDWNNTLIKKNKSLNLWKIGGITVSSSLLILLFIK